MTGKVKTQVGSATKYTLRWNDSPCWAVFFVDEQTYCLTVMSDFGDYAYRWGQPGESFKRFLIRCGADYVMRKLRRNDDGNYFDYRASLKKLEGHVLTLSRSNPDIADEVDKHLEQIKGHGPRTAEGYQILLMSGAIAEHTEDFWETAGDLCVMTTHPWLQQFMDKIWPEFIAALKAELGDDA